MKFEGIKRVGGCSLLRFWHVGWKNGNNGIVKWIGLDSMYIGLFFRSDGYKCLTSDIFSRGVVILEMLLQ